jgi:hypothetical protein
MTGLRTVSAAVAAAVATAAADEGLAQTDLPNPDQQIHDAIPASAMPAGGCRTGARGSASVTGASAPCSARLTSTTFRSSRSGCTRR